MTPEKGMLALMLEEIRRLRVQGASFAFETTLASHTFAPLLRELKGEEYRLFLLYFWSRDAETAIDRVANRVRLGGHYVPDDVVRRWYERGLRNFFTLYRPLADTWRVYDNSGGSPALMAYRLGDTPETIVLPDVPSIPRFSHPTADPPAPDPLP